MNIYDIALTMTPGLGTRGIVHLLEHFSSAENIFSASLEELMHFTQLRGDVARSIVLRSAFPRAEAEIKYCKRHSISVVCSTDECYPPLLREIPDYPHVLYVLGDINALSGRNISVVGTRRISAYGDQMCHEMVRDLGALQPDITIVSGLAFGVDSSAHRAALNYNIRTVAVVANPLPSITPTQHTALAADIINSGGAIVSEYPSTTKYNGKFYLARNRIVAAMSSATIIVESPISGGSIFTAKVADDYQRLVMAFPGRITDKNSAGCNMLIKNNKAQIYISAQQLLRELMWDATSPSDRPQVKALETQLSEKQQLIISCFKGDNLVSLEEIHQGVELEIHEVSVLLMELELEGVIRMLHGNKYQLLNVVVG